MAPVGSFGPWIVRRTIQGGGRGNAIVYEVAKAGSSARLALKTPQRRPPSESYQRFRDEVDFHRKYQDPGILPMLEGHAPPSLARGERAWMVMPLATPFQIALADADLRAVVVAIASVADTLSRLASAGVHHRDIKPPNLFVRGEEHLIGDFGLVAFPNKPDITGGERHLGPIHYIAPEMVSDPVNAQGEPADVYSLAKTLWVLATGVRVPVPGPLDIPQLALRSLVGDPRALLLEPLLGFATRFDPLERPSLEAIAIELRTWLAGPVEPPKSDNDRLEEAATRLSAILAPRLKRDEAELIRVREMNLAFERIKAALDPVNTRLGEAIPFAGRYDNTGAGFEWFDHLGMSTPRHRRGWAAIFRTPGKETTLFAWIGVQMGQSGSLRLASAYFLNPYDGTKRELIWAVTFDALPGGAAEARAVDGIRDGLIEHLPEAVAALADALG